MNTSNLRTVCWIVAAINDNSVRNDLKLQIIDKDLHEIITNASRSQTLDSNNLKKFHNLINKNLLETFEAFLKRDPNWSTFISCLIGNTHLPPTPIHLKDIIYFQKRFAQIKLSIYEGEYKLISIFNDIQAFCLINDQWHDCSSSQLKLIEKPNITFPTIFVYIRVKRPWIAGDVKTASEQARRIQKLALEINMKTNGKLGKETSVDSPKYSSRNHSNPPRPFSQEYKYKAEIISKMLNSEKQNKESPKQIIRDDKSFGGCFSKNSDLNDLDIKILIDRRFADLESRLKKTIENNIYDSLELYKKEESLKYQQAKEDLSKSIINYASLQKEAMKETEEALKSLERKCCYLLERLPKKILEHFTGKFKEIDSKLEKFDSSKNYVNQEAIIEKAKKRACESLEPTIDKANEKINKLYLELKSLKESKISIYEIDFDTLKGEIKILKEKISSIEYEIKPISEYANPDVIIEIKNILKEYADKEIKASIKNEINEVKNDFQSKITNISTHYSANNKFDARVDELNRFIEEIRNQNSAMNKFLVKNKSEYEEFFIKSDKKLWELEHQVNNCFEIISETNNLNKNEIAQIKISLEFKARQIQTIEEEIAKNKSEIIRQPIVDSNKYQASQSINISLTEQPPRRSANVQHFKNYDQILSHYAISIPVKRQIYSKSGLPNIGNTCYMNSVIQILGSIVEFTKYINKNRDDILLESLNSVISLMNGNAPEKTITPHIRKFKDIISGEYSMYIDASPNDAKELFSIISSKITETNLFTIVKSIAFTCELKSHKSPICESSNFVIIPKNYQNSLEIFLNNLTREKSSYSGDNKLMCEKCGTLSNMKLEIEKIDWPNILTVYMPDREYGREIPDKLIIETDFYQIFGAICYYGFHFIAFTKNSDNEWEKYNDSEVSKDDPSWDKIYLAFYKKKY